MKILNQKKALGLLLVLSAPGSSFSAAFSPDDLVNQPETKPTESALLKRILEENQEKFSKAMAKEQEETRKLLAQLEAVTAEVTAEEQKKKELTQRSEDLQKTIERLSRS